jgi:hypothetical protein
MFQFEKKFFNQWNWRARAIPIVFSFEISNMCYVEKFEMKVS